LGGEDLAAFVLVTRASVLLVLRACFSVSGWVYQGFHAGEYTGAFDARIGWVEPLCVATQLSWRMPCGLDRMWRRCAVRAPLKLPSASWRPGASSLIQLGKLR